MRRRTLILFIACLIAHAGLGHLQELFATYPADLLTWVDLMSDELGVAPDEAKPWR